VKKKEGAKKGREKVLGKGEGKPNCSPQSMDSRKREREGGGGVRNRHSEEAARTRRGANLTGKKGSGEEGKERGGELEKRVRVAAHIGRGSSHEASEKEKKDKKNTVPGLCFSQAKEGGQKEKKGKWCGPRIRAVSPF